jgi:ADP-glucose pyrophosphorylase
VLPASVETRKMLAFPFDSYWEDIGTVPSYYAAHMKMAQGSAEVCALLPVANSVDAVISAVQRHTVLCRQAETT